MPFRCRNSRTHAEVRNEKDNRPRRKTTAIYRIYDTPLFSGNPTANVPCRRRTGTGSSLTLPRPNTFRFDAAVRQTRSPTERKARPRRHRRPKQQSCSVHPSGSAAESTGPLKPGYCPGIRNHAPTAAVRTPFAHKSAPYPVSRSATPHPHPPRKDRVRKESFRTPLFRAATACRRGRAAASYFA